MIGAGPNGLVAANYLADAGWSVTVLEAAGEPGGAVKSAELTLPGYRHDLFSAFYPLAPVSSALYGLGLEEHGLRWRSSPLALAHPFPDGRCAVISTDLEVTAASLEEFAPGDGAAWRAMFGRWKRVSGPFLDAIFEPFPPVLSAGKLFARLGATGSLRLARHLLLPVRRMAEELFSGEGASVLLGGNAAHTDISPEGAGSGLFGWLLACLAQQHGFPVPEGGASELTASLVRRLESKGGKLHCDTEATEVLVRRGRAVAVRSAADQVYSARRAIVADVSAPALYQRLLEPEHLPTGFLADVSRFAWDSSTIKVDWALSGPVPWASPSAQLAGTIHIADDFDNLTESASQVAMGLLPARPFLIFGQPCVADPSRSPAPGTTAWAYSHVPRRPKGDAAGVIDVSRGEAAWVEGFVERIESRIENLAGGFRSLVQARHVYGPADLEAADANLDAGAVNGGTAALHQQLLLRPVPGAARPETPISGLYLASASAHPGGGVHGAAGANAARAALLPAATGRAVLFGRGSVRSFIP